MAKIIAPNKQYTGISASIPFINGQGETDSPVLIDWFRQHGYIVEDEEQEPPKEPGKFDGWNADQLRAYAEEHGINIGQATSVNGIMKKIEDAEKKGD
ncbi:MAG TPA: hypothetical protein GXX75_23340 [Clostridiales bacterium]|nr:hypothetical protein [Clostridiales bacterium]